MGTMINVLRSEIICVVRRRGMRWGSVRDIVRSGWELGSLGLN